MGFICAYVCKGPYVPCIDIRNTKQRQAVEFQKLPPNINIVRNQYFPFQLQISLALVIVFVFPPQRCYNGVQAYDLAQQSDTILQGCSCVLLNQSIHPIFVDQ